MAKFRKNVFVLGILLLIAGAIFSAGRLSRPVYHRAVTALAPEVKHPLSGVMKTAIDRRSSELQLCYNSYLTSSPTVTEGYLKIQWHISKAGEVTAVEPTENQFSDNALMECILDRVRQWSMSLPTLEQPIIYGHKFKFRENALPAANFTVE